MKGWVKRVEQYALWATILSVLFAGVWFFASNYFLDKHWLNLDEQWNAEILDKLDRNYNEMIELQKQMATSADDLNYRLGLHRGRYGE